MKGLLCSFALFLLLARPAAAGMVYEVVEAVVGVDGVQRLELVADSYLFKPNYLVVKAGVPVELMIKRASRLVPHNFVLKIPDSEINIKKAIDTDGTKIRFTPRQPGKYPFYCSKQLLFFESHREMGMEGVIEVKP